MIISFKNKKILSYTMDIQKFQAVTPPIPKKIQEDGDEIPEGTIIVAPADVKKKKKEKKEKKKSRKRCQFDGCRVKLKLTDMECRCKNRYCTKHRLPETHKCVYDYKNINMKDFCKHAGLGGGEVQKLTRI